MRHKIIRTSTIALSLNYLLKGQLNFLNQHYEVLAVSGEDEHLQVVAERELVQIIDVPMERKMRPFKDLNALFRLYKLFKKEKPLIVHSITPKAGLLTMLAGYFAGVPLRLHTFTGLIFPTKMGFTRHVLIAMDRILCKCATSIYPEGEGVKQDLIKYNITNKTLKVIANGNVNGIDLDYFDSNIFTTESKQLLRNNLNIDEKDFIYIFVGRLVSDKGINELVTAFEEISKKNKRAKLLLVGSFEADLDPLNQETLQSINNNVNIISVGFQNDVRPYFSIADVLVFPSYREGFPNVVLQAGSMALPSIVSNINGCNEIIVNGENGLIIEVKNVSALVVSMKKIMEDLDFMTYLRVNCRQMVSERFSQDLVWRAVLAEYEILIQNV